MRSDEAQALAEVPEEAIASNDGQPEWVTGELPAQYGELAAKIKALHEEAHKYEKIAAVLWQTGTPLVLAVRDLFAALQFKVEMSESGSASYDLSVQLENGRRLLVEVVGGPEAVERKSPHIGQVLHALQDEAREQDRVVMVANTHCETPLANRRQEPVTPDALRLIQGLGANFIATPTLFGIWRYSLQDLPGARKSIARLHSQDGGIFR
jgi:hypothetical protein